MTQAPAIYSIQPISRESAKRHIASMFVGLQSQDKGGLNDALVANYLEAVADIPEWAVEQATEMYRTGKRGNGRFVPMGAELAKCARELVDAKQQDKLEKQRRKHNAMKLSHQISERKRLDDFHAGKTDDSRNRVRELLEKTKTKLTADQEAMAYQSTQPEILTRTHKRFAPQARASLLKSLSQQGGQ